MDEINYILSFITAKNIKILSCIILLTFIYFFPVFVMNRNDKAYKNYFMIKVMTIGFGWTGFLWLYALWLSLAPDMAKPK